MPKMVMSIDLISADADAASSSNVQAMTAIDLIRNLLVRVLEQQVTKVDRKPHSFFWELCADILINGKLRSEADCVVTIDSQC